MVSCCIPSCYPARLAGLGSRPGTRAAAQPQGQQQLHGAKSGKPQLARRAGGLGAVAAPAPAAAAGRDTSIKLPSSGMTQSGLTFCSQRRVG